ncbi:MAG: Fic family protein [Alphaproteobacteria bacterium]|jgi:Fic family protein
MNKTQRIGTYIKKTESGEEFKAYLPKPLPPVPAIMTDKLYPLLDLANAALGRLDGMSRMLPDLSLFLYMYIRKEAVLSSQIEGTQSSLSDLLLYEVEDKPGIPLNEVEEVSHYVAALNYGLERIKEFPLSLRLIREIHLKLMTNARGGNKQPGEFRTSQNWLGGTRPGNARFVPPPPENLQDCLDNFEKFLHDDKNHLPILVKAALIHVQFETIHPFLDGNGRLGRLLITFLLCVEKILKEPMLYLSLYLKAHRDQYYAHLQNVREKGEWEEWIKFFLTGVIETAEQASETARSITSLFVLDGERIKKAGKTASAVSIIYPCFQKRPLLTTSKLKEETDLSLPTILRNLKILEEIGIIKEISGKERNKLFVYEKYLDILNQGTDI